MRGRQTSHPCPDPVCGNSRLHWKAVCDACWARLPSDHRSAINAAGASRAPHRISAAAIAATNWLIAHPVGGAIARVCGEGDSVRESL